MNTVKAVAYIRVSTEEQVKNGQGLEIQRADVDEYTQGNHMDLIQSFEDHGVSGANDISKRAGLNKLMKFIAHNEVDCLLITKMDRLARDVYIQLWIEKELKIHGVELISINEDNLNGNDYMTTAMRQMVAVFAELEKNRIADRLVRGRQAKADKGHKSSGNCPIGYMYNDKKHVVVDLEYSSTVKDIFSMYLNKISLQKIANKLNDSGATTPRGNEFSKQTIQKILKNNFYTGIVTFRDVETQGNHEPLISKITFGKVQASMSRNRRNKD